MTAKCCKCNKNWNVSIKTDLSKEYICPKCEVKEKRTPIKTSEFKNRKERVPNVLFRNRKKFQA